MISKPHWANGQWLDRGLRTPPSWCIFGVNIWHWLHFFTYFCASFAYLATNSPKWWLCKTKICLLYGFHKSFRVTPQGVTLMSQGECRVDMAQKRSSCTIFGPRIAKNKAPFSVFCQLLIYPPTRCHLWRIVLWGPSSKPYFNLVNMDHLSLYHRGFAQVCYKDNLRYVLRWGGCKRG